MASLQARADELQRENNVDGLIELLEGSSDVSAVAALNLENWEFTGESLQRIQKTTAANALAADKVRATPDALVMDADGVVDPTNLLQHATGLKAAGNDAMKQRQYADASGHYEAGLQTLEKADGQKLRTSDARQIIDLRSVLFSNLSQGLLKSELFRRALEAASSCLKLDDKNAKALYRRAQCHDRLKQYKEALADLDALQCLDGAPSLDELTKFREAVEARKVALDKKIKDESPDSDDECDADLVRCKQRFDEVIEKYNLKDEETASEIADWMTRANCGESTVMSLKDLENKWGMDEDDALAFLAWIDKAQQFRDEQAQAAKNFQGM